MLSIIKRLFGNKSKPSNEPQKPSEPSSFQKPIFAKSVACSILDRDEDTPINKWYRRDHWKSEHFLRIETRWDTDWKVFESEEKVAWFKNALLRVTQKTAIGPHF